MTPAAAPAPDPFADRRLHPRVTVALPAFLSHGEQRHSVQIVDLSAGGAKLRASLPDLAGAKVLLDCGGGANAAVVRWQDGPFVGLSFDTALSPREVAALAGRSTALAARMRG